MEQEVSFKRFKFVSRMVERSQAAHCESTLSNQDPAMLQMWEECKRQIQKIKDAGTVPYSKHILKSMGLGCNDLGSFSACADIILEALLDGRVDLALSYKTAADEFFKASNLDLLKFAFNGDDVTVLCSVFFQQFPFNALTAGK